MERTSQGVKEKDAATATTDIPRRGAKEAGGVCYIHGHLPVFQHAEGDMRSLRMFTSLMIMSGKVKPKEIVNTFGVPMITVKRYMKLYRDQGAKGFYEAQQSRRSASVLKGVVLEHAQLLVDEGRSVPEVAGEVKVMANTLHKAIRAGVAVRQMVSGTLTSGCRAALRQDLPPRTLDLPRPPA